MENITVQQVKDVIEDVYKESGLDVSYEVSNSYSDEDLQERIDKANDYTDLAESLKEDLWESENLFNIEIIYYATAMEYLMKNDCSLQESMSLAHDMGFELKNINSELLASILASENAREDFNALWEKVENHFEAIAFEKETDNE